MPSAPILGSYGDLSGNGLMFRNKLINGGFDIWQRGGSLGPFTDEQYVADRWRIIKNDTVNYSVAQLAFTLGQTDVPGNPRLYHRLTCNSIGAANDFAITCQRIENVVTYSGITMTLSFWAKADQAFTINPGVGTNRGAVGILQNFGSGGSPSASVLTTIQQSQAVTTAWTKYTYTFTVPSVSGKTLGTTANSSYLEIYMFPLVAGNAGRSIDIANVQLESGPIASSFEQRPIGTELALCQRYYEQNTNNTGVTANYLISYGIGGSNAISTFFPFVVEKRRKADLAFNFSYINAAFSRADATNTGFILQITSSSASMAQVQVSNGAVAWTANAEL